MRAQALQAADASAARGCKDASPVEEEPPEREHGEQGEEEEGEDDPLAVD